MPDVARAVAIQAEHVHVTLAHTAVLRDVHFNAKFGAVTAILGPNGAGKSTLLRALAGLSPYQGRILIDGTLVEDLPTTSRAQVLAYVPQRSLLSAGLRVDTIVAHGRIAYRGFPGAVPETHDAIAWAMEKTDVTHLRARKFTTLSVGERRRVLLARGLAGGARIMLLDEPTSALDVRHVLEVGVLLRDLAARGYAVVIVLHALNEARRIADEAVLLREGALLASGNCSDVIRADVVRHGYGVELLEGIGLDYALQGPGTAP